MRKEIFNSRWFHYGLLVLLLAAATAGGVILLGCSYSNVTVVDASQRHPSGGVNFSRTDSRTEARVNLEATIAGAPVTWTPIQGTVLGQIPDASKSNETVILFPPDGKATTVTFTGTYVKDGRTVEVHRYISVHVEN